MDKQNLAERLSRTVKMAMDSGEAATVEEAERIFRGYQLTIEVGPDVAFSSTLQAALLTAVNTGRRGFLGGVIVGGNLDSRLLIRWRSCRTLAEAVRDLRGNVVEKIPPGLPRIVIGDVPKPEGIGEFAVRETFNGWSGGVIPLDDGGRLPEKQEFTPAGVLAGALAVSEAFQHVRGNPMAGRRDAGLSLWRPEPDASWRNPKNAGPPIVSLPSQLWLIGLGHLGQAFLWTLGFLPYAKSEEVLLVLQDFDFLSEANDSTSPLTFSPVAKERKTRAMATWCEERGFRTTINERPFTGDFRVVGNEPMVGVCGVDNPIARAALEDVGFERIIEAGLGKGEQEYLAFQVHTFPGPRKARERWGGAEQPAAASVDRKPAYEALAREGLDDCGLTTLAGRSVGACFVGAATSALIIAELLRMVHGGRAYGIVDGTLRSIERREVVGNDEWLEPFNPGVTEAIRSTVPLA
jgi:hypothetical protein